MDELNRLIDNLIKEKGGSRKDYLHLLNTIGWHESIGSMEPTLKQGNDGPGRGLFQFEVGENAGGITAAKRTKQYLESLGEEVPVWLNMVTKGNSLDASRLPAYQQKMLFLGNMRMHPRADLAKVINGEESIRDFWANYHWAGDDRDRQNRLKSFASSEKAYQELLDQKEYVQDWISHPITLEKIAEKREAEGKSKRDAYWGTLDTSKKLDDVEIKRDWAMDPTVRASYESTQNVVRINPYLYKKGSAVHEFSHATKLEDEFSQWAQRDVGFIPITKDDLPYESSYKQYLNRGEVFPRLMKLRYLLNAKPGETITPEKFQELPNNADDIQKFYKPDQIIDLLNKSVSTPDTQANNIAAYGGGQTGYANLFNKTLNSYGVGGSHESNPHGGVPIGMGANGKMNTVEQGETSYPVNGGRYVFSDRINLSGKLDSSITSQNTFSKGGYSGPGDPPTKKKDGVALKNRAHDSLESLLKVKRKITDEEIASNRKKQRELSDQNPLNQWSLEATNPGNITPKNLAEATVGLESQFRISDKPNFFDDWINPAAWIGTMASNLGGAPQKVKETGSYLPLVASVGEPVLAGLPIPFLDKATKRVGSKLKNKLDDSIKNSKLAETIREDASAIQDILIYNSMQDMPELTTKELVDQFSAPGVRSADKTPIWYRGPVKEYVDKVLDKDLISRTEQQIRDVSKQVPLTKREEDIIKQMTQGVKVDVANFVQSNHGFAMWLNKKGLFVPDINTLKIFANDPKLVDEFLSTYRKSARGVTIPKEEIVNNTVYSHQDRVKDALTRGGSGRAGQGNYSSNSEKILDNFSTPQYDYEEGWQGVLDLKFLDKYATPSSKLKALRDNIQYKSNSDGFHSNITPSKPIIEQPYAGEGYERIVKRSEVDDLLELESVKKVVKPVDQDIKKKMGQYGLRDSKQSDQYFHLDDSFYKKWEGISKEDKSSIQQLVSSYIRTHIRNNPNKASLPSVHELDQIVKKLTNNKIVRKGQSREFIENLLDRFNVEKVFYDAAKEVNHGLSKNKLNNKLNSQDFLEVAGISVMTGKAIDEVSHLKSVQEKLKEIKESRKRNYRHEQ